MARITVEDCLEKIDSQYDLVLLAKERALQLNAGEKALVSIDNDKNTVISLREIGDGKISPKIIKDFAINRLRKIKSVPEESEDIEIDQLDDFDKKYKGEISKSGAAILPSKRSRRISEKMTSVRDTVVKDDETKEIIEQTDQEAENESTSADNKTE